MLCQYEVTLLEIFVDTMSVDEMSVGMEQNIKLIYV
jgi:hypothetical protein